MIERTEALGFAINHVYGLTEETYGPISICDWNPDWDALPEEERSGAAEGEGREANLRHGPSLCGSSTPGRTTCPRDGETTGEVVMRGNIVMKGYYGTREATADAFRGGWFHSGDPRRLSSRRLVELRDRTKDIVISGGENISTIEVEQVIARIPGARGAVVASSRRWGERPKAFVTLRPAPSRAPRDHRVLCEELPELRGPAAVEFGELPKTSTGKVEKYKLRECERRSRA